jgi:NADH:ubiquinone oxidoreductase subunit F (NADH-binding)
MEPRVLLGVSAASMPYERHLQLHGALPRAGQGAPLADELDRSKLRGRGGGAFPLAAKLEAVNRAGGAPVVVVNGAEGEPLSAKDRVLLQSLPHLVIDGAISVARAIGAGELFFAVDETSFDALESLRAALDERPELRRARDRTHVVEVPPRYVAGHESAVVNFINGGPGKPTFVSPRITERGVARAPTLVSNVETFAHVALIARHGAGWYSQIGPADEPGSSLLTLRGAIEHPGVYEVEHGSSLRSVVDDAGGLTERPRAFLLGGYAGTWLDGGAGASVRLSAEALRPLGASLGAGVIAALPESACPVAETVRVARWLAEQSAGQCGPCTHGLAAISGALAELGEGAARPSAYRDLQRWAGLVTGRGACSHPDGVARFVTSSLRVFAAEFDDHARHGICDACDRHPVLYTPSPVSA